MIKNITQMPNGKFTVRISFGSLKNRFRKRFTASSRQKLIDKVLEFFQVNPKLRSGIYEIPEPKTTQPHPITSPIFTQEPPSKTLRQALIDFIKHKVARNAPATVVFYKEMLINFGNWYGSTPLDKLSETQIDNYIIRRKKAGIYENTISKEIKSLNTLLIHAQKNSWMSKELRFKPLKTVANKYQIGIVDKETFSKILPLITDPYVRLALQFMRYCGLRPHEAKNLRHKAIDVQTGYLSIGSPDTSKTKTRKPRRMKIPALLLEDYKTTPKLSVIYVCPSKKNSGKPISDCRKAVKRACKTLGIVPFKLKNLRHSFNTQLSESGYGSKIRATLLGHTTTTMTENVYTIASEKILIEAMESII
ncbi:tyrosine-type recombinase/integrase [Candidatus Riflebacteria bacterium]